MRIVDDYSAGDRQLAWELYVELTTRVATVPLAPNEGLPSEALDSLRQLIAVVQGLLRAWPANSAMHESLAHLVTTMIDTELRPFLHRWNSARLDTKQWSARRSNSLRAELSSLRSRLSLLAQRLADIAEVDSLVEIVG